MDSGGPLHEPPRPGEEPLQASHDRGRPRDALAPAAHVEVEHGVVGVALAQRAEVRGLQPGLEGVGGPHGRRPDPTLATAGNSWPPVTRCGSTSSANAARALSCAAGLSALTAAPDRTLPARRP